VLPELDWFDEDFTVRSSSPAAEAAKQHLKGELLTAFVKVEEPFDEVNRADRTYLICRSDAPLNFDPKSKNACFANRNTPTGSTASVDSKDQNTVKTDVCSRKWVFNSWQKRPFVPVGLVLAISRLKSRQNLRAQSNKRLLVMNEFWQT
jgi:hypothetical protein